MHSQLERRGKEGKKQTNRKTWSKQRLQNLFLFIFHNNIISHSSSFLTLNYKWMRYEKCHHRIQFQRKTTSGVPFITFGNHLNVFVWKRISYKRCIGRPRVVIISCSKGKKYVRKNIWIQRMPCNSTRSNSFETYVTLYTTRIKSMNVYDQNISNTSTMMIFHFNLKLLKSICFCYFDTDLSYSAFLILSWKWENM